VLDGDRRAIGDELQQIDVGRRELPGLEGADVEHPDRSPAHEQRHAEQRL